MEPRVASGQAGGQFWAGGATKNTLEGNRRRYSRGGGGWGWGRGRLGEASRGRQATRRDLECPRFILHCKIRNDVRHVLCLVYKQLIRVGECTAFCFFRPPLVLLCLHLGHLVLLELVLVFGKAHHCPFRHLVEFHGTLTDALLLRLGQRLGAERVYALVEALLRNAVVQPLCMCGGCWQVRVGR